MLGASIVFLVLQSASRPPSRAEEDAQPTSINSSLASPRQTSTRLDDATSALDRFSPIAVADILSPDMVHTPANDNPLTPAVAMSADDTDAAAQAAIIDEKDNLGNAVAHEDGAEERDEGNALDLLVSAASTDSTRFVRASNPAAAARWRLVQRKIREGCFKPDGAAR
jgi:hypothetical protein